MMLHPKLRSEVTAGRSHLNSKCKSKHGVAAKVSCQGTAELRAANVFRAAHQTLSYDTGGTVFPFSGSTRKGPEVLLAKSLL